MLIALMGNSFYVYIKSNYHKYYLKNFIKKKYISIQFNSEKNFKLLILP